jgi:hypothetical protein
VTEHRLEDVMITKTLIGLSALISAGWIVGADPAARPVDAPVAKFVERFPTFEELMLQPTELKQVAVLPASTQPAAPASAEPTRHAAPVATPKADKEVVSRPSGCESQTWPYIAASCLTSIDGSPVRRPARTITIERKLANGSILVQAELAEMVTR